MGDQSTLIYSQPDGRAEGGGEEEKKMGLREIGGLKELESCGNESL